MIINFNNPLFLNLNQPVNMYIKGVTDETSKNNPDQEDKVQLSSIALELGKTLLEMSTQDSEADSQDTQDSNNSIQTDESTGLDNSLTPLDEKANNLIKSLKESSKELPKPDANMNDIHWGAMVQLGETIGIEDEEVLASLTKQDLHLFYNEFVEKEGISDPSVKQFDNEEDFWKTVFQTDENGEFIKENGRAVHNTEFEFVSIKKPNMVKIITAPDGSISVYQNEKITADQDLSTELTAVSPMAILRWTDAIKLKNDNMKWQALDDSSSGIKGIWEPTVQDDEEKQNEYFRKEFASYMLQSKTDFNDFYIKTADTNYKLETFSYKQQKTNGTSMSLNELVYLTPKPIN